MQVNTVLKEQTKDILNKLEKIYGAEKCKDVLINYISYIEMKKAGEIELGNYNIFIQNKSEYSSVEEVVEIVHEILKRYGIVNTSYKYLTRENIRKHKENIEYSQIKEMKEELLIIDTDKIDAPMFIIKTEIKEVIKEFKDKIFIIIDDDEFDARTTDSITWTMEIERISKNNKIDYINSLLKKSSIKVDEKSKFISSLANEPFWKVKEKVLNIILECKLKDIKRLNDETINIELNKKDNKKTSERKKNKKGIEELDSMIGMQNVKEQIEQIMNFIKVNKKRRNMPALHMCFMGNPGTGKTTVARIVGKIFAEMEILSNKEIFVEAQRSDLIGQYVGHTAPQTEEMIKRAEGGVLFIDEAYSIASYIQDEGGRDYGAECISTLIKEMEDKRDKLCVILAGYSNEMEHMLQVNPGFESRIQFKIEFPDYSKEELYEIFKKMAKTEKYKIASNIKEILTNYFESEKQKENFSNARCVRNLFEKVKFEQATRVAKNEKEDINLIKKVDIENVLAKLEVPKKEKAKIGFVLN